MSIHQLTAWKKVRPFLFKSFWGKNLQCISVYLTCLYIFCPHPVSGPKQVVQKSYLSQMRMTKGSRMENHEHSSIDGPEKGTPIFI